MWLNLLIHNLIAKIINCSFVFLKQFFDIRNVFGQIFFNLRGDSLTFYIFFKDSFYFFVNLLYWHPWCITKIIEKTVNLILEKLSNSLWWEFWAFRNQIWVFFHILNFRIYFLSLFLYLRIFNLWNLSFFMLLP